MRKAYLVLSALLLLSIGVQFYFAGIGAFAKPQDDNSFALHKLNGMAVIPALSILATIAAAAAKAPRKLIGLTILPALLIPVQALINTIGGRDNAHTTAGNLAILGFHVINGVIIMMIARSVLLRARALSRRDSKVADGNSADNPQVAADTSSSV